jgi:release factor glutamine methyltransferase
MTVDGFIARARAAGLDRLDAQLLLADETGRNRAWLLAHGDAALDAEQARRLMVRAERRAAGEPLAYLLGEKEFHGLVLKVDARVLVPRPETELLVDWALELLRGELVPRAEPKVLDLGTGSGAIALAVKHAHPRAAVFATDLTGQALQVAQDNATRLGLAVAFAQGSWWQAVPGGCFDLALANPPYIAAADHHLNALRHEPRAALTPGTTGLEALTSIIEDAHSHLADGAWLLMEHGFDQAGAVRQRFSRYGFRDIQTRFDLAGHPRCTGARL